MSLLYTYKDRVFIGNGTGKSRKLIWLGGINLSLAKCKALFGMHAFTGKGEKGRKCAGSWLENTRNSRDVS